MLSPSMFLTQYSLLFKLTSPGGAIAVDFARYINHPYLWLGKVGNERLEQSTSKTSFALIFSSIKHLILYKNGIF